MRRPVSQRKSVSKATEAEIQKVNSAIRNPEFALLCENCYPNTLDTTVEFSTIGGRPDILVITEEVLKRG